MVVKVPAFCTSGAALAKAGKYCNNELLSGAVTITTPNGTDNVVEVWLLEAESVINSTTRFNWTDAFTNISQDVQYILSDVCSDLTAIKCINYDMSGFTSRAEAIAMVNILRDNAERGLTLLKDKTNVQPFIEEQ